MEIENDKNKTTKSKRQLTLLDAVETIASTARNSQLSDEFMKQCKREIKLVADSYGITAQQAILFCITLECGPYHVRFNELSSFLNMCNVKSLTFGIAIKGMIDMRILRYCDRDKDSFSVNENVLNALRENRAEVMPKVIIEDSFGLFDVLDVWFNWLNDDAIHPSDLIDDLNRLYQENNSRAVFARQMTDLKLDNQSMLILSFFCHRLINADDDTIVPSQLTDLFTRRSAAKRVHCKMSDGSHPLMQAGWLEHMCNNGIADNSAFRLTDKARTELLGEFKIAEPTVTLSGLMEPEGIKPKTMFYPVTMQRQIDELNSFLDQEQFAQIQQRLSDSGFRTGFACLFYGAPGTGKTETVYQLARATGRGIMLVDVPQIKSKWVGDSEKNIKAIFDRYRSLADKSDLTPILLFNEADAIFGVRKNGAENAVDKMENAIQNIILQEMENLNGILIATTNLASNLDGAFERRFLYKVRFEKPDSKVRSSIWHEMIPELTDSEAMKLADAYELSGGQIENVARKHTVNRILHGDSTNRLALLMDYCKDETLGKTSYQRMGFQG